MSIRAGRYVPSSENLPGQPVALECPERPRGDLVDRRPARMHTAMRRALQMGHTEESQRLAMHLLRRAQASKGIFSINDLFKEFVLTEPRALERWDVTLEHYQEASRLYDEFELAKTKTDTPEGTAGRG